MRNTNKKGFTIVELVVVVAVIAILAAVLIPVFSGIINKANQSADQKAIRDMNVALAAEEANGKPASFNAAVNALLASNISMENHKALASDRAFYWVKTLNRVVYVDKDMNVTYPKEYVGTTYDMTDGWYSLSGEVETSDAWKDKKSGNTVSVGSGAELVSLMQAFVNNDTDVSSIAIIKLTADIDLKGAAMGFGEIKTALTFDGNNKTIYNMRSGDAATVNSNNAAKEATSYGFGLFGTLIGSAANVTVQNVTFVGTAINSIPKPGVDTAAHAGVIAGRVISGAKLTVNNVTIDEASIRTEKKAGALVGYVNASGKLVVNGVTVVDTTVTAGREGAALIGFRQVNASSVNDIQNVTMTNVTVEHDASYGYTLNPDGKTATQGSKNDYTAITSSDCWLVTGGVAEAKNYH